MSGGGAPWLAWRLRALGAVRGVAVVAAPGADPWVASDAAAEVAEVFPDADVSIGSPTTAVDLLVVAHRGGARQSADALRASGAAHAPAQHLALLAADQRAAVVIATPTAAHWLRRQRVEWAVVRAFARARTARRRAPQRGARWSTSRS